MKKIVSLILIFAAIHGWATPIMPMMQVSGPFYGPVVGAAPSGGGLAIVTGVAHGCTNHQTTTADISCTVTGANGGGNGLVIFSTAAAGVLTFSDSAGTPATPVTYTGYGTLAITIVPNASAGAHTITMHGGDFQTWIAVREYSGVATSSPLGANNGGNDGFFSPISCTALTTTQTNSMTIGVLDTIGGSTTGTWGALTNSFVQRDTDVTSVGQTSSSIDNVATLNGSSGSSISTTQAYTGGNEQDCLLVEIKHS